MFDILIIGALACAAIGFSTLVVAVAMFKINNARISKEINTRRYGHGKPF